MDVDTYVGKCKAIWNIPRTRDNLWRITSGYAAIVPDWEKMSKEDKATANERLQKEFAKQKHWPFQKKIKGEGSQGDVLLETPPHHVEIVDSEGQLLHFRVGMVFSKGKAGREDGLWIEYQQRYMAGDMAGPFLMSEETWKEMSKRINAAFRRSKKFQKK